MATTTIEQGDANGKTHKFKYAVDDATGALSPIVSDGAGTTTTLEQGDANGVAHKMKYQVDVDGVTLMPVVTGAAAGAVDGGLPPLTTARTVYVSASGNDANPGTQAQPFLTIARAWAERQKYGEIRAEFRIQFVGVGPFPMVDLSTSFCRTPGGFVIFEGDKSVETTHATGTFAAAFAGPTVAVSAGLGVDTHRSRWVRVTSGVSNGAEFLICEHTDATITACRAGFGAVAAGDTFAIFTPGTTITTTSPTRRLYQLFGGSSSLPGHIFHGLVISGSGLYVAGLSLVAVPTCKLAGSSIGDGGMIIPRLSGDNPLVPLGKTTLLGFAGAVVEGGLYGIGASAYGMWVIDVLNWSSFGPGINSAFVAMGGRYGTVLVSGVGALVSFSEGSSNSATRHDGTIDITDGGSMRNAAFPGNAICKFAVTVGDCIKVRRGGILNMAGAQYTGGTTAPAGCAINVSGGGRAYVALQPTWTGGTAGQDLKTTATATPVPNSVLAAVPSAVDALGSPYAEALCRVP